MSEAGRVIKELSEGFDPGVIRMKPGSQRKPATKYVSHGLVTKRLNSICPGWSTRIIETHTYLSAQGVLVCAGVTLELTIPGVGSRVEVGTANQPRTFGDDLKNAMSDALKRCAMRFGVALDLWEDMDEHDEDAASPVLAQPPRRDTANPPPAVVSRPRETPAAVPIVVGRVMAADEGYDDNLAWTEFWAWAKKRGYPDRHACAVALGKADDVVNGWTPAQIRTALEVAHQRAG